MWYDVFRERVDIPCLRQNTHLLQIELDLILTNNSSNVCKYVQPVKMLDYLTCQKVSIITHTYMMSRMSCGKQTKKNKQKM